MSTQDLATALQRVETVLRRRPDTGLHDDAPATARWNGGTQVVASHANGTQVATDMPCELGGGGTNVTPGWLFRAGLASCSVTSIAMAAAAQGIELAVLEVRSSSQSDTRGLLGLAGTDGEPVHAGPSNLQLQVRIRAPGVAPEVLRTLVAEGLRRSPIPSALPHPTPFAVHVDAGDGVGAADDTTCSSAAAWREPETP